jgi:hypothetical protein
VEHASLTRVTSSATSAPAQWRSVRMIRPYACDRSVVIDSVALRDARAPDARGPR